MRIKEILPESLSRYFFFDGERIEKLRAEIGKNKSKEFAVAVRSLLGLDAMKTAIDHLGKVINRYNEACDPASDATMKGYARKIKELHARLEDIDQQVESMIEEEETIKERCNDLRDRIAQNKASEHLAKEKARLEQLRITLTKDRDDAAMQLVKHFNKHGMDFFAIKPAHDALKVLQKASKLDKGIPDIHERTLDYLLKRGICLCGTELAKGTSAHLEIEKLRDFIPPKAIGALLDNFTSECRNACKNAVSFFDPVEDYFSRIRNHARNYGENDEAIKELVEKLRGCENVGQLQTELTHLENSLEALQNRREDLIHEHGSKTTEKERQETERNELAMKDKANRRFTMFKAYAQKMWDSLGGTYSQKEAETRRELEKAVNAIFQRIYKGGLSLSLDEKYNIMVNVVDQEGWRGDTEIETSTAQGISICFAFIAGVIELARGKDGNGDMNSEAYPLVMDAPLSAFDKTRIQTVCDELPRVAEQVIIFIKDTDGELAEKHLGAKVGKRYTFDKINEFETVLREGK